MLSNRIFSVALFLLSFLTGTFHLANAQSSPNTKDSMVGEWLVTIKDSAPRKLVLNVKAEAQKGDALSLDATFGFLDGEKRPLAEATLTTEGTETKLAFRTQSGNRYIAVRNSRGAFDGAYTAPSGQSAPVVIERASGQDVQATTDLIAKQNAIVPPESSVPKDCAVFSGAWGGEWRNGGYRSVLRVLSIDSSCVAAYSINGLTGKSKISDGKLEEFLCVQRTDGRCTFKYSASDDTLSANYWNPSGGRNYGTFTRVK